MPLEEHLEARTSIKKLRVLIVHSVYQTEGGEELAVKIEDEALRARGVSVKVLLRTSDSTHKAKLAAGLFMKGNASKELSDTLKAFDPHVVHFHNIMPHWGYGSLGTAMQWALPRGRRIFSTIHNQRWTCSNGLFFRNGKHCQLCFDRNNPLWGAVFNCRQNYPQSLLYSTSISWAHARGYYNHPSHTLIALNEITARRLKQVFPVAKTTFLANPVHLPLISEMEDFGDLPPWEGRRFAIIGRLSTEKGILKVLSKLPHGEETQFVIAGTGPLRYEVENAAAHCKRILYLGHIPQLKVAQLLRKVDALFFSSIVEEQSPSVVRLAYKLGIPIYGWQGPVTENQLASWGPVFNKELWIQKLLTLFGYK